VHIRERGEGLALRGHRFGVARQTREDHRLGGEPEARSQGGAHDLERQGYRGD